MKTKTLNTENDNPMFAFLPEMVLDHLSQAKPTESTEIPNEPIVQKITITAEPHIPNLDSNIEIIPKKEKTLPLKTVDKTSFKKRKNIKKENIFNQILKSIKNYLHQFLNQLKWKQTC
jgi:phosphorylcholine metabolism protein LicD